MVSSCIYVAVYVNFIRLYWLRPTRSYQSAPI